MCKIMKIPCREGEIIMKRKMYLLVCAVVIGLFCGCGDTNALSNTNTMLNEQNATDTDTMAEKDETEEVKEEEEEKLSIHVSNGKYDGIWALTEEYLLFKENDLLGVMDKDENVIFPASYMYSSSKFQDSAFTLYNKDNGIYDVKLFDRDLNVIYEEQGEYYITDYFDGVVGLRNQEGNSRKYLDAENGFSTIAVLDADTVSGYEWSSACNNGIIVISSYMYGVDGFINYMDKEGNIQPLPMFEDGTFANSRSNAVNSEGWFALDKCDLSIEKFVAWGFYNINTGTFVESPIDGATYGYHEDRNGVDNCTVINEKITVVQDKYNESSLYAVYDLAQKKYLSVELFLYIELSDNPMLLYQNTEEQWGYVDSDFNFIGETYEDASNFQNGYALIHANGAEYFINEKLEIVSDPLEGETATVLGNGFYRIKAGESYYFAYIEQ